MNLRLSNSLIDESLTMIYNNSNYFKKDRNIKKYIQMKKIMYQEQLEIFDFMINYLDNRLNKIKLINKRRSR